MSIPRTPFIGIAIAAVALAIAAGAITLAGALGAGPAAAGGDDDERSAFAEALGVTVEQLEAAKRQVMLDRIAAAVESGALSEERAATLRAAIESGEEPGHGRGFGGDGFGFGWHGDEGDEGAAFAEALGVTVEQLESAMRQVALARIDAAVEAGKLTEARAATLRAAIESGEDLDRGFGHRDGRGDKDAHRIESEGGAALATALGVTVEQLEAAFGQVEATMRQRALDRIDAELAAGRLTEARAERLRAAIESGAEGRFFHRGDSETDEGELLAGALGVTVERLEAVKRQLALDWIDAAVASGKVDADEAAEWRVAIESGERPERGRGHERGWRGHR